MPVYPIEIVIYVDNIEELNDALRNLRNMQKENPHTSTKVRIEVNSK